ncbi:replication protein, partial [uncultured marine virus]
MVEENSSNSSGKSGNNKQISPCKHWCFTLNNYKEIDIEVICSNSSIKRYVFQEEIGVSGTPHLQGYLEFITKKRPKSEFKSLKAHWTKTRQKKESIIYCQKADTRAPNGRVFRKGVV